MPLRLEIADNFVMLFNGRIVFKGMKEEYLNSGNEYLVQYRNMANTGPMVIL